MNQELRKVSLRQQAVFLSEKELIVEVDHRSDDILLKETTGA
ncbi:hypothetical protein PZB74_13350 [Porifericola rhodea]|nr:hypothetical protein [Porifericola rhodea]WKN29953.1 hypothetical protein PZB74_13350 [Porifericola rhodea]